MARHFATDTRVRFDIRPTNDVAFSVYGVRYLLAHGDMLGVKGGDGIIGKISSLEKSHIERAIDHLPSTGAVLTAPGVVMRASRIWAISCSMRLNWSPIVAAEPTSFLMSARPSRRLATASCCWLQC